MVEWNKKTTKQKIKDIVGIFASIIPLTVCLALLTAIYILPENETIEYELTFDSPVLVYNNNSIEIDDNSTYYIETSYDFLKSYNNTIYVTKIEGSFQSEGTFGGKELEIPSQVILYYLGADNHIHYLKYEKPSRYYVTITMNSTYLKIRFEGAKI